MHQGRTRRRPGILSAVGPVAVGAQDPDQLEPAVTEFDQDAIQTPLTRGDESGVQQARVFREAVLSLRRAD